MTESKFEIEKTLENKKMARGFFRTLRFREYKYHTQNTAHKIFGLFLSFVLLVVYFVLCMNFVFLGSFAARKKLETSL